MNHKIRRSIGRKLPKIIADTAGNQTIIENPLTLELGAQFFRITDRKNDPGPAGITRQSKKQIPADKSGGAGQEKLHGR